jgi:hypothetical protein
MDDVGISKLRIANARPDECRMKLCIWLRIGYIYLHMQPNGRAHMFSRKLARDETS